MKESGRRDFLRLAAASGFAVGATGCSLFIKTRAPGLVAKEGGNQVSIMFKEHPTLTQDGGELVVQNGEQSILVFRRTDGSNAATDIECTHWGCHVVYDAAKDDLKCPCHGSRFAIAGAVTEGPADDPLKAYPVQQVEGGLKLTV